MLELQKIFRQQRPICSLYSACLLSIALAGCALEHYTPAPLDPLSVAIPASLDDTRIRAALDSADLVWPPQAWDLSMVVAATMAIHPALTSERSKINVTRAGILSAAARPNPVLSLPFEYHSRREDDDDNQVGGGIGLSWVVQARGSRQAAVAAAEAERRAAQFDLADRAWQLRRIVRTSWAAAGFAERRLLLLERGSQLAKERSTLIAARLQTGETSAVDLAQARLNAQSFDLRMIEQRVAVSMARARLAAAMGIQANAFNDVQLAAPPDDLVNRLSLPELGDMQRIALTERADVLATLARYLAAEARLEREVAKQMPDITLSPSWFYEQGDNIWALATGLPIPIMNRNEGPIAIARAERELAAARFRELQTMIVTNLQLAQQRCAALARALGMAADLVAAAANNEAASEQQVVAGYGDHLSVLQAKQERLNANLQVLNMRSKWYEALGDLEDAVRQPLDGSVFGDVDMDAMQNET